MLVDAVGGSVDATSPSPPTHKGQMAACLEPVCTTHNPLLCQSNLQHWIPAHAWYANTAASMNKVQHAQHMRTTTRSPGALLLCSGMAVFQLQWGARRCGPVAPGANLLGTLSDAIARGPGYVVCFVVDACIIIP